MTAPSARLARWAADSAGDWSAEALRQAGRAFVDTVACMLAGAEEPVVLATHRAVAPWGAGAATSVARPAAPAGLAAPWAALVNGAAAHSQDYDDVLEVAAAHASAVLVPAVLALGEEIGSDGRGCAEAYLVGFEVLARLGEGVNWDHYRRGWHTTSTLGTPAAAAACGRLLGLDATAMAMALSLGFSMAAGSKRQFGTMAKPLHAGLAAKNGVLAARLAAQGITGNPEMLVGSWSFADMTGGPTAPGFETLPDDLGRPPAVERHGIWVKPYPCCASAHRPVDLALRLAAEHDIVAADIAAVEATVSEIAARNLMFAAPATPAEARFSLQYCVAAALVDGALGPAAFADAAVHRPEVRSLMTAVSMGVDPDAAAPVPGRRPDRATLAIALKDGRRVAAAVAMPPGHPGRPLDDAALCAKFRDCAATAGFDAARTGRLHEGLAALASQARVAELTRLFRP